MTTLILAYNQLDNLEGISSLRNLKVLDLRANRIATIQALIPLQKCETLERLSLESSDGEPKSSRPTNLLCLSPEYRNKVCNLLLSLTSLDGIDVERVESVTPLFDKVASRYKSKYISSESEAEAEAGEKPLHDTLSSRLDSIQQKLEIERLETELALLGQSQHGPDSDAEHNRIVHTRIVHQPTPLRLDRAQLDLAMQILQKEPRSNSEELDFAIQTIGEMGRRKLDQGRLGGVLRMCFPDLENQTVEQLFQTLSPKRRAVPALLLQDLLYSVKDLCLREKKVARTTESISTQSVGPPLVDAGSQVTIETKPQTFNVAIQARTPSVKHESRSTQTKHSREDEENTPPNREADTPWQAMSFLQTEMEYIRQRLDVQLHKKDASVVDEEGWSKQLGMLKDQLEVSKKQHAKEMSEITGTVEQLKRLRENLESALAQKVDECTDIERALGQSETRRAELERELQRLESGGQVAQEQLAARAAETSIKLEKSELELTHAREEARMRAEEARQLEMRVSSIMVGEQELRQRLDTERTSLLAAQDEVLRVQQSLKSLTQERDELLAANNEQTSVITRMKKDLREAKRLEREKALDLDVLAGLVRDQKEHIRSLVPMLKRTQLELERSKTQKDSLVAEVEEMKGNLVRLKDLQGLSQSQEALTNQARNDAKQLHEKLEAELVDKKQLKARLEATVSDLETNLKIKVAMLEDQNKQIASLKSKLVATKEEFSRVQSDYEDKLDAMRSSRNAAEEAVEDQERALEKYEAALQQYEDDKDIAKIQRLEAELSQKQEALGYVETELESLVQKFSSRNDEYKRKEAEFAEKLKANDAKHQDSMQSLQVEREAQAAALARLETKLAELTSQSKSTSAQLDISNQQVEHAEAAKAAADARITEMQQEINILAAALESERAKNALNRKRFENLMKDMR